MERMRPTTYRPNVGAVLRRDDGLLLMCERLSPRGVWQFPQGGIDAGESIEQALWRELGEELGFTDPRSICAVVAQGPPVRYDFPADYDAPVARLYRGQEQTLFLLQFAGTDSDFALDQFVEPEFASFGWFGLDETIDRLWEFKRGVLLNSLDALGLR